MGAALRSLRVLRGPRRVPFQLRCVLSLRGPVFGDGAATRSLRVSRGFFALCLGGPVFGDGDGNSVSSVSCVGSHSVPKGPCLRRWEFINWVGSPGLMACLSEYTKTGLLQLKDSNAYHKVFWKRDSWTVALACLSCSATVHELFIRQLTCHDSITWNCSSIITALCCSKLSTIHSGHHCSSDPVQVQSLVDHIEPNLSKFVL